MAADPSLRRYARISSVLLSIVMRLVGCVGIVALDYWRVDLALLLLSIIVGSWCVTLTLT